MEHELVLCKIFLCHVLKCELPWLKRNQPTKTTKKKISYSKRLLPTNVHSSIINLPQKENSERISHQLIPSD